MSRPLKSHFPGSYIQVGCILAWMGAGTWACNSQESHYHKPPQKQKEFTLTAATEDGLDSGVITCVADHLRDQKLSLTTYTEQQPSNTVPTTLDALYDAIDGLLQATVNPASGLVDYQAIAGPLKSQWDAMMTGVKTLHPPQRSDAQDSEATLVSYWLNIYNVLMIDIIVNFLSTAEVVDTAYFDHPIELTGTDGPFTVTLNTIEYRVIKRPVFPGTPHDVPRKYQTAKAYPETHVGFVCGAAACPKLRHFAYRPDTVQGMLTENLYMFFNDDNHFSLNDGKLFASSLIVDWYPADFDKLASSRLNNDQEVDDGTDADDETDESEDVATKEDLLEAYMLPGCRQNRHEIVRLFHQGGDAVVSQYPWDINRQSN